MYVLGTSDCEFLEIQFDTMTKFEPFELWHEITRVAYKCNLDHATIFPDYDTAMDILKELKANADKIKFKHHNLIGQMVDEKNNVKFDINSIKIYTLIPKECNCL